MIGRREFVGLVGGAVAWPVMTRAQEPPIPVVGFLRSASRVASAPNEAAFRLGLASLGFFEGRNVTIDYRYAENQIERLPTLASDLTRRPVAVIYGGENASALAARAATTTLPIVFRVGGDPVKLGLVEILTGLAETSPAWVT
jgi:ABC-type uncharacterized transport system substrate-binding protein